MNGVVCPHIDGYDRGHRRACSRRPGNAMADEAKLDQESVHNPILVMQHPLPHLRRDDRGDRPRDQHHGAQRPAALDLAVDQKRDRNPGQGFERHRNHGEKGGVAHRMPPVTILHQRQIVAKADEARQVAIVERGVHEGKICGARQGPGGDCGQHDQHRGQQQPGFDAA